MRASAAIAAMVVKAPMRAAPSAPQCDSDGVGRGRDIDQRSSRNAAAPPFGKIGTGGAEFGAWRRRSWLRKSCGGPPFQCGDQAVGPDRDLGQPDADGVANGVGDRRRSRHGCDLADADAAAEHVVEAAFVEMHVDRRACRRCRECDSPPFRRSACRRSGDRFRALRKAHSRCPGSPSPPPGCAPARALRSCRPQSRCER